MIRRLDYRSQFQDFFAKMYPEVDREAEIYRKQRETPEEARGNLSVKTITLVVTESCNLACTYCYQCDKDFTKFMTKETAKEAIDMILDDSKMEGYINSKETPCVILEFIGGEPLLQIDLIDYVCDYFRYKAAILDHPWMKYHMFNITTNGVLFNSPKVQAFIKKNYGRLSFTITIDGDKDLHDACRIFPDGRGSYDVVSDAVSTAQTIFGSKTSKITLAPENIAYLSKAVKHLHSIGLTDLHANVVYENVWKPDRDAPIFYDQLMELADWIVDNKLYEASFLSLFDDTIGKPISPSENQNWCGGNGQMLAIGTDGRLFPCLRYMKYSLADKTLPEMEIGNIKKGIEPESENKFLQEINHITRRSQSTDECFNCSVASGCAWCTAYNYDEFKTPNKRATYICEMHKTRSLVNYYYWNKVYKKEGMSDTHPLNLSEQDIQMITKGDTRWQNI